MTALRSAGVEWYVALTSPSIAAIRAGVVAGLGVSAFGHSFVPDGLVPASPGNGLPALPDLEFGLERREGSISRAVEALASLIEDHGLQAMKTTSESRNE